MSFAVGALYHAYLYIRATPCWAEPHALLVPVLDRAFVFVWTNFTSALPLGESVPGLITELESFSPGEDDAYLAGQPDLVDGMLRLLSLRGTEKPGAITDIASFAYQAIIEVALPGLNGGEEDHLRAERSSEICIREIEFQEGYLLALENLRNEDAGWDGVLAQLGSGARNLPRHSGIKKRKP